MKKLAPIVLLLFFFAQLSAQNISDLESFEKAMKPGTQLTYDVTNKDLHYQLVLTIKKLGDEISFDWKTTAPDNKSGTVTMNAAATGQAEALQNNFKGGTAALTNETSIWISKKVFTTIASTAQASIKMNGASDTVTVMANTIGEYNFNLDGNLVAVPGWEMQGGGEPKYTIDILESTKFPILYKVDMGWSMVLSEVKGM